MMRLVEYFSRWQSLQGGLGRLPGFARFIVILLALPALLLAGLSILLLAVSILALLLLPWPTYRLLRSILCDGLSEQESVAPTGMFDALIVDDDPTTRPRRHVEVRIVE